MSRCKDAAAGPGWKDEANVTITPSSRTLSHSGHAPSGTLPLPHWLRSA